MPRAVRAASHLKAAFSRPATARLAPRSSRPAVRALLVAFALLAAAPIALGQRAPTLRGGSWWERTDPGPRGSLPRSRFYTIRSDLPAEDTRRYANLLDTMYLEYTRLMKGLRPRGSAHLDVFMFATEQDYLDTLRTRFGASGTGSGGMFFVGPKGAGLAFFTQGLPSARVEHVIRHEGFHQIANIFFDHDLPPWANEGLAEYFGESVVVNGTVIEGQMTESTLAKVKSLIEQGRIVPFEDLLSRDLRAWNGAVSRGTADAQYAQSASMVHFLLWGEGGRLSDRFSAYLRNLNEGRDPVSSFRMAFGGTDDRALADFERRWREFVKQQSPGSVRAAMDRLTFLSEGLLRLRDRNVHPSSLEELKSALKKEGFTLAMGSHAGPVTLRAEDESLYSIPPDQIQDRRRAPEIEFVWKGPKPPRRATAKDDERDGGGSGAGGTEERSSDAAEKPAKPPPLPELSTRNLRPRNLKVSWKQGADGGWSAEVGLE